MSIDQKIEENEKLISLGGANILTHYNIIPIPDGTELIRVKRRKVNFFKGTQPDGNKNGWFDVPDYAKKVSFPEYRVRSGTYGAPKYDA